MRSAAQFVDDHAPEDWTAREWMCAHLAVESAIRETLEYAASEIESLDQLTPHHLDMQRLYCKLIRSLKPNESKTKPAEPKES